MNLFAKIYRSFIYYTTLKPKHYVHIDKPKNNQDKRQIQYNNWCKRYGMYCGSYLPVNPKKLERKGWRNITNKSNKTGDHLIYERKSSGQIVRYDKENDDQYAHYHWNNLSPTKKQNSRYYYDYYDRYGKPCIKVGKAHHLAPLDKEYIDKKKTLKRNNNVCYTK